MFFIIRLAFSMLYTFNEIITYFWIEHRALGRYSQMALYFYERVYDDAFSSTCWANNHCTMTRWHCLIQLNDFVLLIFCCMLFLLCILYKCVSVCWSYRWHFMLEMWFHVVGLLKNKIERKQKYLLLHRKKRRIFFLFKYMNYLNEYGKMATKASKKKFELRWKRINDTNEREKWM